MVYEHYILISISGRREFLLRGSYGTVRGEVQCFTPGSNYPPALDIIFVFVF